MSNKKILIINDYSIENEDAVGITLRSIFNEWDIDNILEIYRKEKKNKVNSNFKTIFMPKYYLPLDALFRKIFNKETDDTIRKSSLSTVKKKRESMISFLFNCMKFLSEYLFFPNNNSGFMKEVIKYSPDYIYTIGGSISSLRIALYFSKKFDIPIVVHYMDNWKETLFDTKDRLNILNFFLNRLLTSVEKRMDHSLVISDKMNKVYSKNKNIEYHTLMNSVNTTEVEIFCKQSNQNNIINFVYIGGIHLNRWETLLEFEEILIEVKKKYLVKFNIYSNSLVENEIKKKFDKAITTIHEPIPHNKIQKIYSEADILVHVESFRTEIIKYTKYSLSTKIPEYMFNKKPIVYLGPKETAVYDYIIKTNTGVASESVNDLHIKLIKLLDNPGKIIEYGKNGEETVMKNHSEKVAQKVLFDVFK